MKSALGRNADVSVDAGYVGFDPLGFSTLGDVKFLREAEVKHGRVAMLAAAGAIAQDLYHFPVYSNFLPRRPAVPPAVSVSGRSWMGAGCTEGAEHGRRFFHKGVDESWRNRCNGLGNHPSFIALASLLTRRSCLQIIREDSFLRRESSQACYPSARRRLLRLVLKKLAWLGHPFGWCSRAYCARNTVCTSNGQSCWTAWN
jgi:hypothetical protein